MEKSKRQSQQMAVIVQHRLRIDPLAEVGEQVGSQFQETRARQRYNEHSQSEPIQGRCSPEDEYRIHKRLDEK